MMYTAVVEIAIYLKRSEIKLLRFSEDVMEQLIDFSNYWGLLVTNKFCRAMVIKADFEALHKFYNCKDIIVYQKF